MKQHTVQQGEDLISIAAKYHISDWRRVYDHPANQRLKAYRPNPMTLTPGDMVYIPDSEPLVYTSSDLLNLGVVLRRFIFRYLSRL